MNGSDLDARRLPCRLAVAAVAGIGLLAGARNARAVSISTTYNDWAGTVPATSTSAGGTSGWGGWGGYTDPAAGGAGSTHTVRTSNNDIVTFSNTSTDSSTSDGLINYEETNNGSSPLETSYAGDPSTTGSVQIHHTTTGYGSLVSSQLAGGAATATAVNAPFLNALANNDYMTIDVTTPLGGTTLDSSATPGYFIIGFKIDASDNNFNTYNFAGQEAVQDNFSATSPDPGNYGDTTGAFEFNHGSYYTVVIPYTYTGPSDSADYEYSSDNGTAGSVKLELTYNSGAGSGEASDAYLGTFTMDNLQFFDSEAAVIAANTASIPEPATLGLIGLAAIPALMRRRRV